MDTPSNLDPPPLENLQANLSGTSGTPAIRASVLYVWIVWRSPTFRHWFKITVEAGQFIEGADYVADGERQGSRGKPEADYLMSHDMAAFACDQSRTWGRGQAEELRIATHFRLNELRRALRSPEEVGAGRRRLTVPLFTDNDNGSNTRVWCSTRPRRHRRR